MKQRSRIIHPGFFNNEVLAELALETRLLFIGLWTIADKEGRLEDRPKRIKLMTLPFDDVDVDGLLSELHRMGFIRRYSSGGNNIIQVLSWHKFQKPHNREAASSLPLHNQGDDKVNQDPHSKYIETEVESEIETKTETEIETKTEIEKNEELQEPVKIAGEISAGELVDLFNKTCLSRPKVRVFQPRTARYVHIVTQLKSHPRRDFWEFIFKKVEDSEFLSGRNGKWTACNFDWVLEPGNLVKIYEDTYANGKGQRGMSSVQEQEYERKKEIMRTARSPCEGKLLGDILKAAKVGE